MKEIKKFFRITEKKYVFEWCDISAILTILNVTLVLAGFWFAPIFGLMNCVLSLVLNVKFKAHINMYVIQIYLVVLNIYFLTL